MARGKKQKDSKKQMKNKGKDKVKADKRKERAKARTIKRRAKETPVYGKYIRALCGGHKISADAVFVVEDAIHAATILQRDHAIMLATSNKNYRHNPNKKQLKSKHFKTALQLTLLNGDNLNDYVEFINTK